MQLVAYGAQDIYLTGNPQITFFKVVYRRHTNFSMETIEQTISGTPSASGSSTVTISRNGDLVYKVYITSTEGDITKGSGLCSEVELEIGGQRIDRHYEEWNQIWWELTTPGAKQEAFKYMIGDADTVHTIAQQDLGMVQIPLNFWFCRNPGLALPLIALQYHEVKLKFTWSSTQPLDVSPKVMADYIYLDTDERRRFAQVSHEYLIEQLQKQSADTSGSFKLNFNHPVKELIWTSAVDNSYGTAQLKLNGHDRFSAQEEEYFQLRQCNDYHTAIPGSNVMHGASNMLHKPQTIFDGETATVAPGGTAGNGVFEVDATGGSDSAPDNTIIGQLAEDPGLKIGDTLKIHYESEAAGASTVSVVAKILSFGVTSASEPKGTKGWSATATDFHITVDHNLPDSVVGVGSIVKIATRAGSGGGLTGANCHSVQFNRKINVYSFALKPEEHQPSGTCNFSRIDNAKLDIGTSGGMSASDNIYAVNYNVLRIMSGMGGLAYSN